MGRKVILPLLMALLLAVPVRADAEDTENSVSEKMRLPVVMYHHISPKEKLWGKYVISPRQFERDLIYLKDNGYTAVSTDRLLAWRDGKAELPEKPVLITFDDGYESTVEYALPLLEKYGMTAVVAVIGSVCRQYSDTPDHTLDYSHMSWESVGELEGNPFLEVQCHSYDMHKLGSRRGCAKKKGESPEAYRAALREDTELFQKSFEEYTGRVSNTLALPFGSYTQETLENMDELGFEIVFTCEEKINETERTPGEMLVLCRYNRPSGIRSGDFFAKWN